MKATRKMLGKVIALLLVAALCLGCVSMIGSHRAYASEDADTATAVEQMTDDSAAQTDEAVVDEIADVPVADTAVIDEGQDDQTDDTKPADSVTEEEADSVPSFSATEEAPENAGPSEEELKEETAEETTEETVEETYPAASFVENAGGTTVRINAPEGALPEGASVETKAVSAGSVESAVKSEVGENVSVLAAVDISFFDKDGKSIEPKKRVSVQFVSDEFKSVSDPMVVHVDDAGDASKVADRFVDANGKSVGFEAKDFSIYVVVEGEVDPDARLNVNFYEADGETLIAEMSITRQQLQDGQMNVNIYDPGVGTMETGDIFKGWTENKDFDVDDAEDGFDIAEVRTRVTNLLNSGEVEDGDEIDFYAMMFKSYHISYRDELGVTIYTDEVLYKEGTEDIPYTFQFAYTPYYVTGSDDDDETKAANFDGWMLMEPEESPAPIYDNGDSVDLADFDLSGSSLTLTVMAQVAYGHWLVFNENGSGVSFTPPLFVGTDETPNTAGMPDPPTRTGYTFGGWYTSDDCTTEFDASQPITETTNVWAKWEENEEASFSVLIWAENLSGGYDFVRSINIADAATGDTMSDVISGAVGASTIRVNGNNVFIPMNDDENTACAGFMYEKFDTNTDDRVSSDGNSILNIYFERRTYNLKFYYARSQNGRYQVSQITSATGTAESFDGTGGSWAGNGTTQPGSAYGTPGQERRGNYTYYYRILTAEYGEEIGDKWPTYNGTDFATWNNYRQGSWAVMRNSGAFQNDGQGTVKGKITVMDEHILGDLASSDGNYVFANYDTADSQYSWVYHIYFRNEAGNYELEEDVDALSHDSGNNWATQQHPPAYPGMEEVRRTRVGNNREINYYYDPLKYPILFMDGIYVDGNGTVIDNKNTNTIEALEDDDAIAYRSSVAKYNSYDPTDLISDGSRFVFLGWYSDDQCTKEYTFDKMPVGGIKVYAKWILKEYKVELHPRENGDESFKYINGNSAGEYGTNGDEIYVDNGEKVANVGGTRDLYDLIGWFTNESLSKVWDFDAFPLNDTIVGKYGKLYSADEIDPAYPGTVGEVNLYANWRRILDGADGINVVYTAVGKDGDGNPVEGSNPPVDPNKYSDQAQAIARPAATAPEADPPLAFQYWVVQKWNGSDYEDTDPVQHVFPGDRFIVNYDDAKVEDDTSADAKEGAKIYTVQLRAQYASAEDATPTHIYWYDNYTDSEAGILHKDEDLAINEAVDIQPAPERTGYEFLGWARMDEIDGGSPKYTYDLDEDDLLVTYNSDTGKYTFETNSGNVKPANGVFADENTPYQGMYAVWKELDKLTYDKNGGSGDQMDPTYGNIGDAVEVSENTYTRDGYEFTGWNTAADGSGTAYEEGADYTLTDGDDILYAQWESTAQEVSVQINGNSVEKPYNGEYQDGKPYTLTWFVDGEEVSEAPEGVSFKNTAGLDCPNGKNVNTYKATITGEIVITDTLHYTAGEVTVDEEFEGVTYLEITPLPITVALTGNNDTVEYDGKTHNVTGLTFEVSGLLDVDADLKITISGESAAAVSGKDIGKHPMNMKAEDYRAILPTGNNNYTVEEVTIKEDGWLEITPASITIVIKGTEKEYDYDGSAKIAEGYEATCDSPLFDEDKLSYEGEVGSTGTDAGEYPYDLAEDGFTYDDDNVEVTYQITGGNLVIKPAKVTVTTGSDEKTYDGTALTNDEATITGLVEKDEGKVTVTATGSQTEVGSSDNTYEIDWGDVNKDNYELTEELGTLTVTEEPEPEPDIEEFTITYDLNGGEYDGSTDDILEVYEKGAVISIHEAPTRDGYEFLYWKGSEYQPGDSYTVEGDHTFVAQWAEVKASDETDKDTGKDKSKPDQGKKKKPAQKKHHKTSKTPETGDDFNIMILLIVMAAAGGTLAVGAVRRRREAD